MLKKLMVAALPTRRKQNPITRREGYLQLLSLSVRIENVYSKSIKIQKEKVSYTTFMGEGWEKIDKNARPIIYNEVASRAQK